LLQFLGAVLIYIVLPKTVQVHPMDKQMSEVDTTQPNHIHQQHQVHKVRQQRLSTHC
jgi:hypothetical protein